MGPIRERILVTLSLQDYGTWLDPATLTEALYALMCPYSGDGGGAVRATSATPATRVQWLASCAAPRPAPVSNCENVNGVSSPIPAATGADAAPITTPDYTR
jgi:hypothetical protein